MNRLPVVASAITLAAFVAACSPSGSNKAAATAPAQPAAAAPAAAAAPGTAGFTGKVVETMDAVGYTYVQVDTGKEKIWAATNKFDVKAGDTVAVPAGVPMQDFHSAALNRTFPVIYFVNAITKGDGVNPPKPPAPDALMHEGAPRMQQEVTSHEPVKPAPGGLTIAEVYARRKDLAGKEVVVRGRVVKANMGIMGTNWYHIQDGTGVEKDGTHDLTVTSDGAAAVGDVITVKGTLAVDKDLGFGYHYTAIVEKAAIEKK